MDSQASSDSLYEGPPGGLFEPVTMDIVSLSDDIVQFQFAMHTVFYRKKPYHRRIMTSAADTYPIDLTAAAIGDHLDVCWLVDRKTFPGGGWGLPRTPGHKKMRHRHHSHACFLAILLCRSFHLCVR